MPRLALEPADYPFFDYRRFTFSLGIAAGGSIWLSGSTAVRFDAARKAMVVDGDLVAQARVILDTIARHPGRPILLFIDTQGQQLRRRDETLGINRAMAHLGMCVDLARRRGHQVIGLVYDQALSGGFITSGLIADGCYALPEAEIRVMRIPAMARVTKLSEETLTALSESNPVFAPGVGNYVAMGGVRALWEGDLQAALRDALVNTPVEDTRAQDGAARGGRKLAASVVQRVLAAA